MFYSLRAYNSARTFDTELRLIAPIATSMLILIVSNRHSREASLITNEKNTGGLSLYFPDICIDCCFSTGDRGDVRRGGGAASAEVQPPRSHGPRRQHRLRALLGLRQRSQEKCKTQFFASKTGHSPKNGCKKPIVSSKRVF